MPDPTRSFRTFGLWRREKTYPSVFWRVFFFIFRIILLLFFLIQMPIWSIWWIAFITMPTPTRSFWTFGYGRNKTAKMITSLTFVTTYKIVIRAWQIALVTLGPRILFWFWFWRWPMRIPADIWKKNRLENSWKFCKIEAYNISVLL